MFDFPESIEESKWTLTDKAAYNRAVRASTKRMTVNEAQLDALKERLTFSHRKDGFAGCAGFGL